MNDKEKIERMQRSLQRLRDEADTLKNQNTMLKQQLEDKEKELSDLQKLNDGMTRRMEEMLREHGEAVEAAYESRMSYDAAAEEMRGLIVKYREEMKQWIKLRNKIE